MLTKLIKNDHQNNMHSKIKYPNNSYPKVKISIGETSFASFFFSNFLLKKNNQMTNETIQR